MKKLMKRIGAVLMAVAMMAALGVTGAFAVDTTITATNVTAGDSVVYIRLLEPDTTSSEGWKLTTAGTATGLTVPALKDGITEAEALTIAKALADTAGTAMTVTGTTATANVDPGLYYLRATSVDGKTVYNPAFVSADYADGGNNTVSFGDTYSDTTTLKKKNPQVPKEASATVDNSVTPSVQTAGIGETVTYTVTPTFPSYPADATNKTLYIGDTMSAGLTFDFKSLSMGSDYTTDPATITDATTTFTFKKGADVVATAIKQNNGFILTFDYEKIKDDANLTITYSAKINDDAVVGKPGNPNKVTLTYANNPIDGSTFTPTENKPEPDAAEKEKLKTIEDEEIVYTYELAFYKVDSTTQEKLAGAEFDIFEGETAEGTPIDHVTTDANGLAISKKVHAGKYTIKETKAPEGYTLNTNTYTIEAKWTTVTRKHTTTTSSSSTKYTTDKSQAQDGENAEQAGWIKNGEFLEMSTYANAAEAEEDGAQAAYIASESATNPVTVTTEETVNNISENEQGAGTGVALFDDIPNTKTAELPSTGGIGTYVFTVAGVAIMAVAAGLLIVRHKKKAE